jgi:hypothetical protein
MRQRQAPLPSAFVARGALAKQPFTRFVLAEDQDICYL